MNKPNILMVLSDQHNAGLLGCAGHPQALTPNLDRFAETGVRFTNAYTQNTICTPSRVSILSGQYCHNHGIYGLSGPAPLGLNNLMRQCHQHGYRTAGFGKLHLPNRPRNWIADDLDRFGDTYETPEGLIGDSEFFRYLEAKGLRKEEDSWHNPWKYGGGTIAHDARPSELPYQDTQEMWCAREAMRFVDAAPGAPFCVQLAFQKPHYPLLPNQRFWDMYPADLDLPPTFDLEPSGRPGAFQAMWKRFREHKWAFTDLGESWEEGVRRLWRGTLACVSQVDDVFGRLLDWLEERGLTDNTIVIYGADHGAYHGIHGIPEKAPGICSDAVCRVPMIWRVPGIGQAGMVNDQLIENVDMTPTLTSLCDLPPIESVDGLDATGLLKGSDEVLHEVAVTENAFSKALRWDRWRFVHYQPEVFGENEDVGELYDLAADPDERHNLYHEPAHGETVETCRRLLLQWLIRTTRVTATQPAMKVDAPGAQNRDFRKGGTGLFEYPQAGDGRAPNRIQPRFRDDLHGNYI